MEVLDEKERDGVLSLGSVYMAGGVHLKDNGEEGNTWTKLNE